MFDTRIRSSEYPEEGEVVMVKIAAVNDDIVTAKLLEYGNIEGLIMSGELSKKKYRSIHQVAKIGNAELCQVLKVDKLRGHIDLSLKRVGEKERAEGKELFARSKLCYQIMQKVAMMLNMSVKDLYSSYGYKKEEEFGTLFTLFAKSRDHPELLGEGEIAEALKKTIDEQFKVTSFKIRVDVDVATAFGGIQLIKAAFKKAKEYDDTLEITVVAPPTYSITKVCSSKEEGFTAINTSCNIIKAHMESNGGTFSISSPAKVYGDKSKLTLIEDADKTANQCEDSDDFDEDE